MSFNSRIDRNNWNQNPSSFHPSHCI